MIGPGALLLVVSHLFAVPLLVLSLGLEKSKIIKLGPEKFFAGCILSIVGDALSIPSQLPYNGLNFIEMICIEPTLIKGNRFGEKCLI
jgi:hypothetical protein